MNRRDACFALYLSAFPDETPASAGRLFDLFFQTDCLYTLEGEQPVSMLFLLDANFRKAGKREPICYVYGAATHPQYRRQGRMQVLLEHAADVARTRGAKKLCLLPASERLAAYYEGFGFSGRFYHTSRQITEASGHARLARLSAQEYRRRAETWLPDGSVWPSDPFFQIIFEEATASGGGAFGNAEGCLLCQLQGETLLVLEVLGNMEDAVFAELMQKTGAQKALLRGPALRDGARESFGLYLPLSENDAEGTGYFGLGRDL